MPAFDWYQATVPRPLDDVLEALARLGESLSVGHARGAHGYAHAAILGSAREGQVARIWHGGSHEFPHAVVSGEWAQPGAELIRASFPEHSVSRLDVREDFVDEGDFDRMQPHLLDAAKAHRVTVGTAGDHLLRKIGRTVYLGAPSSSVRMRLYDKREEMLAKLPAGGMARHEAFARLGPLPEHWARLESQIRPATKEGKCAFARVEPVEALGCTEWTRDVWRAVAGLDPKPVNVGRGWRQSDDERAYRYLLAQYGGVLRRMQADHGSWECVGRQIGDDLSRGGRK
jgi:hypothetical protein